MTVTRIKRDLKARKPDDSYDPASEIGAGNGEAQKATDDYYGGIVDIPVVKAAKPKAKAKAKKAPQDRGTRRRVVAMGKERKGLTKKAKETLLVWRGAQYGKARDALIAGHLTAARKKFGHTAVLHGSDTNKLIVGIPIPSLSFEFVIAQDAFPLGVIYHLVAKHKIGKSGLLAELIRWFYMARGFGTLCENETKFSPSWYESIIGREWFEGMPMHRCDSVEDWQDRMTFDLEGKDSYKHLMEGTKDKPGPGRTFPILFGVDSIMGKLSRDSQTAVHRDGHAGRGFPVEALQISRYLGTMPQWLDGWPFAVVLVNHLKIDKNQDTGAEERYLSGGRRTMFQESFELEMRKGPRIECTEFEGHYVDIKCAEQSFGPSGRLIRTRVIWWEEPDETGEADFRQKTIWDWDWATVNLLHAIIKGDEKHGSRNVRMRKHLKDEDFHMDFGSPTALTATAWSKTLGVSEKDPLQWHEMGALIQKSPEVLRLLRRALRINARPLLKGDYLEQMGQLAEEMP